MSSKITDHLLVEYDTMGTECALKANEGIMGVYSSTKSETIAFAGCQITTLSLQPIRQIRGCFEFLMALLR